MKRIGFIFLRLLVALYAIIGFPIWMITLILWLLWRGVIFTLVIYPITWVLLGGYYKDSTGCLPKGAWVYDLEWWRRKFKWHWQYYDCEWQDIPQWYFYLLRKMSEYCD